MPGPVDVPASRRGAARQRASCRSHRRLDEPPSRLADVAARAATAAGSRRPPAGPHRRRGSDAGAPAAGDRPFDDGDRPAGAGETGRTLRRADPPRSAAAAVRHRLAGPRLPPLAPAPLPAGSLECCRQANATARRADDHARVVDLGHKERRRRLTEDGQRRSRPGHVRPGCCSRRSPCAACSCRRVRWAGSRCLSRTRWLWRPTEISSAKVCGASEFREVSDPEAATALASAPPAGVRTPPCAGARVQSTLTIRAGSGGEGTASPSPSPWCPPPG